MKSLNKAKFIILVMGLVLAVSVFSLNFLPTHTHKTLSSHNESSLPENVHIPININTADKDTLCLLDGIGETLAGRIISYREEKGRFETKEELKNVYGIGETTYKKLANYICTE